jgi:hypothetical protein
VVQKSVSLHYLKFGSIENVAAERHSSTARLLARLRCPPKSFSGVGLTGGFLCSLTGMIGANLHAPNAITKNALSRLTSYEAITAALADYAIH